MFCIPEDQVAVHFLGVWDTVGSLGIPGHLLLHELLDEQWEFHDVTLSSMVKTRPCHLAAMSERVELPEAVQMLLREPKKNYARRACHGYRGQ